MRIFRAAAGAALVAVVALGAAGCSASGGSSAAGIADRAGVAGSASSAAASSAASAASGAANRSIVRTGTLDLAAKDPIGAAQRISSIVSGAGGHLDADTETPGRDAHADLTARIPASVFEATLDSIEHAGNVRSVALHTSDVTATVTDEAVRIAALEASTARLRALLGRASDTTDLVSLEGALTTRESDLESLQAQQRGLADQVSYASLQIGIVTPAAAPQYRPGTFASGFAGGWAALAATLAWLAVAAGAAAPWALLLAALAAVAIATRRLVRRRRDGRPAGHGAG